MDEKTLARFWSRVSRPIAANVDACWLWTKPGRFNATGYGVFDFNGKPHYAHRLSFEIANGHPAQNLVLHSCDTPACVNPSHLRDGTHLENMKDMKDRDRRDAKGERSPSAKLSDFDCDVIRELYKTGRYTQMQLGKKYKVHRATIGDIVNGVRKVSKTSKSSYRNERGGD